MKTKLSQISPGMRLILIVLGYYLTGLLITGIAWILYVGLPKDVLANDSPISIGIAVLFTSFRKVAPIGVALYFAWPWIEDLGQTIKNLASFRTSIVPLDKELEQAIERAKEQPEKVKPAWDLARVRLELYFDRNLSQINYIFWLSVVVMIVGFGFILFGIQKALTPLSVIADVPQPSTISPAIVGGIAGIITEFIGATFLLIYRSTIQQAANYTKTLERINSVGMAMQILDTISTESKELQDKTKAEIVKFLLSHPMNMVQDASIDKEKVG